jgi:hypothetical protein
MFVLSNVSNSRSLNVGKGERSLEYDDDAAFVCYGTMACKLFQLLDRDEVCLYLPYRAENGFYVIQSVLVSGVDGLEKPNAYGDSVFDENDSPKPSKEYFTHIDYVVARTQSFVKLIGMLPIFEDHWSSMNEEKAIFTLENARGFGRFFGTRYKDKPIIWILGGDQSIDNEADRGVIEAMALGIGGGDGGTHLITYHARGPGLSSDYFHDAGWLDLNMVPAEFRSGLLRRL